MDYQWYPGHMTKAIRMMREQIAPADLVIELADARIPRSSRNPDIDSLSEGKKRLLVLNKADLADEAENRRWEQHFRDQGLETVVCNAAAPGAEKKIREAMKRLTKEKAERDRAKGMNAQIKAMVCGVPNAGKSTLINRLAGSAVTKTENRPGVTRGKQWISLPDGVKLLDTPGVLWPKFEDKTTGEHLALIGSMNDVNLDMETLALKTIEVLEELYPAALSSFYGYTREEAEERMEAEQTELFAVGVLSAIAAKRGCIRRGALPDYEKAAVMLLTDFRGGRIGRFTIERA